MHGKDEEPTEFSGRLKRLAVELVLEKRPAVDLAVSLASDLVAAGMDTPATVTVASLSRGTSLSEAEPALRSMLDEHGVALPALESDDDQYATIRYAFAYLNLPLADFEGPFYEQLVEWDQQGPLDRRLVRMFDERDNESRPRHKTEIESRMRKAIRETH